MHLVFQVFSPDIRAQVYRNPVITGIPFVCFSDAESCASAAAGSGSAADASGSQLQAVVRPSLSCPMAQHTPVPMTMTAGKFTCCPSSYCPMAWSTSLTRIIHQPEKSTGEGDFMVQMSHKTTVSQAHDAPKPSSSGRPDTAHLGRMDAIERTASCQLLGAYLNGLARKPLGLSIDLIGPGKSGARRPIRSNCA